MFTFLAVVSVVLIGLASIGWLKVTYTGVTRPLCQVSLFGFNFFIAKPDPKTGTPK